MNGEILAQDNYRWEYRYLVYVFLQSYKDNSLLKVQLLDLKKDKIDFKIFEKNGKIKVYQVKGGNSLGSKEFDLILRDFRKEVSENQVNKVECGLIFRENLKSQWIYKLLRYIEERSQFGPKSVKLDLNGHQKNARKVIKEFEDIIEKGLLKIEILNEEAIKSRAIGDLNAIFNKSQRGKTVPVEELEKYYNDLCNKKVASILEDNFELSCESFEKDCDSLAEKCYYPYKQAKFIIDKNEGEQDTINK